MLFEQKKTDRTENYQGEDKKYKKNLISYENSLEDYLQSIVVKTVVKNKRDNRSKKNNVDKF
jgi:hypothetical protein